METIDDRPMTRCHKILSTVLYGTNCFPYRDLDRYCQPMPRTALQTVLLGDHVDGWICHFGLKCSSWCRINVGTSGRSACCGIGNLSYNSVREANCMASRNFAYNLIWVPTFFICQLSICLFYIFLYINGMCRKKTHIVVHHFQSQTV